MRGEAPNHGVGTLPKAWHTTVYIISIVPHPRRSHRPFHAVGHKPHPRMEHQAAMVTVKHFNYKIHSC